MNMKIKITKDQFYLLEFFAITNGGEQVIERVLRPLEKLKKCMFTPDGKYVVYEGKAYNTTNGNEVPINEQWSLSNILHTGADLLSMGLDFVIPGTGAIVDLLNGLSYIIEAQFKSADEKDSLYLMAAITFAFVVLPGPLQAIAIPLKRAVKTGTGFASKAVVKGLKIIGGILDTLLLKLPSKINAALKSPLAKNILGKYAGKISGFFKSFSQRIKIILGKITGNYLYTGKTGKESDEKASKKEIGKVGGNSVDNAIKLLPVNVGPVSKELLPAIVSKSSSLSKLPEVALGSNGGMVISKLGLIPNKSYSFGKKTFKIKGNVGEYIDFVDVVGGLEMAKKMKTWDFLKTFILKPSAKLSTLEVPLITKVTVRLFNNGTLNTGELEKIKTVDATQTQKDLTQLSALVAE